MKCVNIYLFVFSAMLGEDGLIVKRARSVDYCPDRNVSFMMTRVVGVFKFYAQ